MHCFKSMRTLWYAILAQAKGHTTVGNSLPSTPLFPEFPDNDNCGNEAWFSFRPFPGGRQFFIMVISNTPLWRDPCCSFYVMGAQAHWTCGEHVEKQVFVSLLPAFSKTTGRA